MSTSPEESGALASPESLHDVISTIRTSLENEAKGNGPSALWATLLESADMPQGTHGEFTAIRTPDSFMLTTEFTDGSLEVKPHLEQGTTVILKEPSQKGVKGRVWTQLSHEVTVADNGAMTLKTCRNYWWFDSQQHNWRGDVLEFFGSDKDIAQRLRDSFNRAFPAERPTDRQKGLLARVSGWVLGIV